MTLEIKPFSANKAWVGRRFKTDDYKNYEEELGYLLLKHRKEIVDYGKKELTVEYNFYIKNYLGCDVGNFEKQLTDILVKNGFITDDRYIKKLILIKHRSDQDRICVSIKLYES